MAVFNPVTASVVLEIARGECYRDEGGSTVWRCLLETTSFPASALPEAWEKA